MATKQNGAHCVSTPVVCIEFLLDETGSMASVIDASIGGFNEFLKEQRNTPGKCQMTLTKFEGGILKTPYSDLDLEYVPELSVQTFIPGGMTNLYDAVKTRIESRKTAIQDWISQPQVLLVVMTDGQDNASNAKVTDVSLAIHAAYEAGWSCVFLGSDGNALYQANQMGFKEGHIKCFSASETQETIRELSRATTVYRTAAASGMTPANFF